jgi:EAL domain-containing protein (putative c-di-GMP-specific phosphodiesterase class I)
VSNILRDAENLERLLAERAAHSLFQPIVTLDGGTLVAYEALGRGTATYLPSSPGSLFEVASSVGREQALSRLLREGALEQARAAGLALPLFLNLHPAEFSGVEWLAELRDALGLQPSIDLVIELSEQLEMPAASLRALRADLDAIGVRLAYDDFGAGLARINELAEAPAHFLKFDYALIHGLDEAGEAKRGLVGALVDAARSLGMTTLAEGIEAEGEAQVCRELGFELGQGYLFGRPAPLPEVRADTRGAK